MDMKSEQEMWSDILMLLGLITTQDVLAWFERNGGDVAQESPGRPTLDHKALSFV